MSDDCAFEYSGTELEALALAANYRRWIFKNFSQYIGETVAEVGAGIGSFSLVLSEAPLKKLLAFEPSPKLFPRLVNAVRHDRRIEPINDFFQAHYVANGVDSVVYINVLEHIENDEAELRKAFNGLREGGHLLVFSPALTWLYSDFDRDVGHYRRYTKGALAALAERSGLEIVKAQYFDMAGILPWYVMFRLLKRRPGRGSVAVYDKLVVPVLQLVENMVPPPIGKNVVLVARKSSGSTLR